MSKKTFIYDHLDFRAYLKICLESGPRGMQAQMARSASCQAIHLIQVIKGKAHLTEDQAYQVGKFLKLTEQELIYFLDMVRLDRAVESETKNHYRRLLESQVRVNQVVKNRVQGSALEVSLADQIQYYGSPLTSIVHLGTSCKNLQTPMAISKWLNLSIEKVKSILEFLEEKNLVEKKDDRYVFTGKGLHLPKESSLHPIFQKLRRELVIQHLVSEKNGRDLYFSSAFATTKKHLELIRARLLESIEETHRELLNTESDELALLVVDLFSI